MNRFINEIEKEKKGNREFEKADDTSNKQETAKVEAFDRETYNRKFYEHLDKVKNFDKFNSVKSGFKYIEEIYVRGSNEKNINKRIFEMEMAWGLLEQFGESKFFKKNANSTDKSYLKEKHIEMKNAVASERKNRVESNYIESVNLLKEKFRKNISLITDDGRLKLNDHIVLISNRESRISVSHYYNYVLGSWGIENDINNKFDLVKKGEVIYTIADKKIISPIRGIILDFVHQDYIVILPEIDYELPNNVGVYMFYDLINDMNILLDGNRVYDKFPSSRIKEMIEALENIQVKTQLFNSEDLETIGNVVEDRLW